jgi:cleavage and polyadenylation specificity factor subunit 2
LTISQFEDNEVGHVRGRVVTHEDSSIPVLEPTLSISSSKEPPSTLNLPQSTLIGDLKLTLLKSRLVSSGISADFAGEGVLVCSSTSSNGLTMELDGTEPALSNVVSVRKLGKNQVLVEGLPSEVYYKVRKEIYALYAIVGV